MSFGFRESLGREQLSVSEKGEDGPEDLEVGADELEVQSLRLGHQ